MTAASWPDHLLTLAEWDALPQDTSRCYELVEGVLLVVPRPAPLHQRAMWKLCSQIENQLPAELTVLPDVEVLVKAGEPPTVRAPDIVITREVRAAANPSRLEAADVLVAVEIISPGTGTTDRVTKVYEYADAGIPHYWLVDLDKPVTLTAYTLVDGNYEHVAGDVSGTVTIPSPVGITLILDALITR
ncbi:MAG: Uma2 family endonuclease [Pseudonocardiaceae bacterium]